jgi:prevent-host-death family protein
MTEEGIRALKQNASQVVARVAAGEIVTITDRGRPVALLSPIPVGRLDALVCSAGQWQGGRLGVGAQDAGRPVSITVNVTTPDARSFLASESQIHAMLARAAERGRRSL